MSGKMLHPVVIQWQQGQGFGVSSSAKPGFGEGADEVYADEEAAYGRVVSLLFRAPSRHRPNRCDSANCARSEVFLRPNWRELLDKQQGEVSKIERRKDVKLSTLRDYVKSIGGSLEVLARLPGGVVRAIELDDEQTETPPSKSVAAGQ
jgi:hypothetical protein